MIDVREERAGEAKEYKEEDEEKNTSESATRYMDLNYLLPFIYNILAVSISIFVYLSHRDLLLDLAMCCVARQLESII